MTDTPDWVRMQAAMMKGIFRGSDDETSRAAAREELAMAGIDLPEGRFEDNFTVASLHYKSGEWRNILPKDDALHRYIERTIPVTLIRL